MKRAEFDIKSVSCRFGRHELVFETGKVGRQANGAVVVKYGATVVLVTACMSADKRPGIDFFPLTVEYREKQYAAGKIPGGFFKREGKPTEKEILSARLIDRPIRPLFPKGFVNDVQIVAQVLSSDPSYDPDIFAILGASCALTISDIPFEGPIVACRIGRQNGEFILNPTYEEQEQGDLDLCVVGYGDKIIMIESGSHEISEEDMVAAIEFAKGHFREVAAAQDKLKELVGKEKASYEPEKLPSGIVPLLKEKYLPKLREIVNIADKHARMEQFSVICNKAIEELVKEGKGEVSPLGDIVFTIGEESFGPTEVKKAFSEIEKELVRDRIFKDKHRIDGRALDEIRPLAGEVGILPRAHGSSLFTRGQTQSLSITTLGTRSDEQMIEGLEDQSYKTFMLHYSFPPFSVGEVKPIRGPGRREIGHGALAERALKSVMPDKDSFPYTVRVVSEILESNGSSSMATVCAASMSLMDAGVPIKAPVAGIAIGLVTHDEGYVLLTDIAGLEDHYGDMDFKVAGTAKGINAVQMDLKIKGITTEMIREAFALAKKARLEVLEVMNSVIDKTREQLSDFAPRITVVNVPFGKIKDLIGPMGKNIKKIIAKTESSIDIDDTTGNVLVSAPDRARLEEALAMIKGLTSDPEVGQIYEATVTRIINFGAFCELPFGKEGLVHISEIDDGYVENVEDKLKVGDKVKVKLIKIDELGRLNLSIKQAREKKDKE